MKYEVKLKWADEAVAGGFDAKWFEVEADSPDAAKSVAIAQFSERNPGKTAEAIAVTDVK